MLCVIVGAGPGLSAAVAERFHSGGYDIALLARNGTALRSLADSLNAAPAAAQVARVRIFLADAANPHSLTGALNEARAWGGPPEVLIYNAARMEPDEDLPDAEYLAETMRTTLGGAVTAVNHTIPAMREAGFGTILITGGGLAFEPYPGWASLAAGKAALRSMTLSWHKAFLPAGIHVASIAVAGIVEPDGPFAPERVAEVYWSVHSQPIATAQREVVFLPEGADPFYNDPDRRHRAQSIPIEPLPLQE